MKDPKVEAKKAKTEGKKETDANKTNSNPPISELKADS
jgi:hypothetical protein